MVINEDNSEANQIKVYVVNKTKTDTATPKWIYTTTDNNGRYQVLLMEMEIIQLKKVNRMDLKPIFGHMKKTFFLHFKVVLFASQTAIPSLQIVIVPIYWK